MSYMYSTFQQDVEYTSLRKASESIITKYFRAELMRGNFAVHKETEHFGLLHKAVKALSKVNPQTATILLTINPPEGVTWEQLILLWDKLKVSKNLLFEATMVLEQRSLDPNNPYGYHMHIATKNLSGKAKSQYLALTYRYYKNTIEDHGKAVVHFCPKNEAYAYVRGIKPLDADVQAHMRKNALLLVDKELRDKKNLRDMYTQCPSPKKSHDANDVPPPVEKSTEPLDTSSIKTL